MRNASLYLPLDKSASAIPHADVALVSSHLLGVDHVRNSKTPGRVNAQKRGTSIVRDLVFVDEIVRLQRIATIATTAGNPATNTSNW